MRSCLVAAFMPMSLAAIAWPAPARAQSSETTAEALFQEGRQLKKAGRIEEACARFDASQRASPSVGALLNVADCALGRGEIATAWQRYSEASALAARQSDAKRAEEAEAQARALEARLPRLVLRIAAPAPGETVTIDGSARAEGTIDAPIPVDPGAHVVVARAPGRDDWHARIDVREAQSSVVDVPRLAERRPAPPTDTGAPASAHGPGPLVWALGGAGVAALAAGTVLFFAAKSDWSDATARCPNAHCPDQRALDAAQPTRDAASLKGTFATALGIAGVGLVGAATLLYVTRPRAGTSSAPATAVYVDRGGGGVVVRGAF